MFLTIDKEALSKARVKEKAWWKFKRMSPSRGLLTEKMKVIGDRFLFYDVNISQKELVIEKSQNSEQANLF